MTCGQPLISPKCGPGKKSHPITANENTCPEGPSIACNLSFGEGLIKLECFPEKQIPPENGALFSYHLGKADLLDPSCGMRWARFVFISIGTATSKRDIKPPQPGLMRAPHATPCHLSDLLINKRGSKVASKARTLP